MIDKIELPTMMKFDYDFVAKIKTGQKIHTIRTDHSNVLKKGMKCNFWYEPAPNKFSIFLQKEITQLQPLYMTLKEGETVRIHTGIGEMLSGEQAVALAVNNGFDSWFEFVQYFTPKIEANPGRNYHGKIIHWTDKRY